MVVGLATAAPAPTPPTPPTALEARYFPQDQCSLHVTQWQKHQNDVKDDYLLEIRVVSGNGERLSGMVNKRLRMPDHSVATIPGQLRYQLAVQVGAVDTDPVEFGYAGQSWTSASGCTTGAFVYGIRKMDCGFTC
ncbi:hypothetical protein UCREL1_9700 [Eutypa lata UCREL1]|uniref:Uncharacterized protein n=1 Tax=Eutypa lata (strain UCR-EL1) TaxID=1287681 RepID=M7SGR6_EUTLA|nr:hypothetical protein UCREL1_9700 [Eutypa lata UCREL1]